MMNVETDKTRMTIESLEGTIWPSPEFASHVVLASHELRKKPLSKLTIDDFRLALTQNIGLQFIVPLVLEILKSDPMIDATYYPGDLMQAILHVPGKFWKDHPLEKFALDEIWSKFSEKVSNMDDDWKNVCLPSIAKEYNRYKDAVSATK